MKNSVSSYIVYAVAGFMTLLILLFAALTTFTFGQSVIGPFVLSSIIGEQSSSLLSGVLTVLLFDAGWIVGLLTFIYTAESLWQQAITGCKRTFTLKPTTQKFYSRNCRQNAYTQRRSTLAKVAVE